MTALEILLVRHGATAGNLRHAHIGRTDEPLCPSGRAALRVLDPSAETVYVSPLRRARETAGICFPAAAQVVVPDLREMDFGAFDGKNYEDLADAPAYRAWVDGWCRDRCPGGEDQAGFCARTCRAFSELVDGALAAGEPRLVIVAHGGTVMAVGERYAVPRRAYFDWKVPNGGVCRFATDASAWAAGEIRWEACV